MNVNVNELNDNSSDSKQDKINTNTDELIKNESMDELVPSGFRIANNLIKENSITLKILFSVFFGITLVCWFFFCQGYFCDYYGLSLDIVSSIMFDFNFSLILKCGALLISSILIVISVLMISQLVSFGGWKNIILSSLISAISVICLIYILCGFVVGTHLDDIKFNYHFLITILIIVCFIAILSLIIWILSCAIRKVCDYLAERKTQKQININLLSNCHFIKLDEDFSVLIKDYLKNSISQRNDKDADTLNYANASNSDCLVLGFKDPNEQNIDKTNDNFEQNSKNLREKYYKIAKFYLVSIFFIICLASLPYLRTLGEGAAAAKRNYDLISDESINNIITKKDDFKYYAVIYSNDSMLICAPAIIAADGENDILDIYSSDTIRMDVNDCYVINRAFDHVSPMPN